jgi:hypothetical protein
MQKKTVKQKRPSQPPAGEDMLIEERRQHILSLLQSNGRVMVAERGRS